MAEREVAQQAQTQTDETKAPEAKKGPGTQALEALLKAGAGGAPDIKKVVAIIDGNRGERDALFAMLHSSLGNAYAQQVVEQMDKLRVSLDRKEVVAGDPSDPKSGYFVAGEKQEGAEWRTSGGGFTGKANKDGLDTTVKTGEKDAIHAKVGADQSGTIAYEHDGKNEGELYGHYKKGSDYEVGARKTWGGGKDESTITAGAHHEVTDKGTTDGVYGSYKSADGKTTADATAGISDGKAVGSISGSHINADGSSEKGSLSHDAKSTMLAGQYKTADGKTVIDGSGGIKDGKPVGELSGTHTAKDGSIITGSIGQDPTTTSIKGTYADKDTKFGASATHDAKGSTFGANGEQTLKDGTVLTASGQVKTGADGTSESATLGYKHKDLTLGAHLSHDAHGSAFGLTGEKKLAHDAVLTGSADIATHDGATTSSIGGTYKNPDLSISGRLAHEQPANGQGQTTLSLSEQYKSGKFIQGFDLTAGHGARDYLGAKGSFDAQLAPHLYMGGFGSVTAENGKQTTGQLGASLTFTPNEKTALTLAGIVDEHGTVETRLQLDVFKKKVSNVQDLADHKKDALVSLFLSYSQQTNSSGGMLDSRYGASQYGMSTPAGGGQVMGGIKINF